MRLLDQILERRRRVCDAACCGKVPEPNSDDVKMDPINPSPPGVDGRIATVTGDSRKDKKELQKIESEIQTDFGDIANFDDEIGEW